MASNFEYLLSNGYKLYLLRTTGSVLNHSESTSSNTYSGRPKMTVIGSNVITTQGDIQTELITTSKIWFVNEDGREEQIDISDFGLPVRAGHKLTFVQEVKNGVAQRYLGMSNDAIGKASVTLGTTMEDMRAFGAGRPKKLGRKIYFWWWLALFALIWLSGSAPWSAAIFVALFSVIPASITFFIVQGTMGRKWAKPMKEVEDKAHEVLAAT